MLGPLAQAERQPLQAQAHDPARGGGHEELAEDRHAVAGDLADQLDRHRHVTPAEDPQALLGGERLDRGDRGGPLGVVGRQEGDARGVGPARREVEVDDLAQERVGDLGEDAGTVTDQRVGAGGTAVLQVAQGGQGMVDDVVPGTATHRGHERDTAGVVLVLRPVEALVCRLG